jgi:uncharacterized membrane protein YeaQ/YmgE (transglycosylase-associated protein family)
MNLAAGGLLGSVIVGLAAGFFAAQVERGRGYGAIPDMAVGVIGAILGARGMLPLGLAGFMGRASDLVAAGAGAGMLLVVLRLVAAARTRS